jgi:ubiquinone/menaquinone biosynthesis C-methylase UbiE
VPDYPLRLSESEVQRYRLMAELARGSEADLWSMAGVKTGARVADVGCGPGAVLALLAEAVGPTGRVVGIDGDETAVAAARASLAAAGQGNAEVRVGRADDTGLSPGSFDVVMLRHVLAHNGGREQRIVNHLASLARPGGSVYLVDVDLAAMRVVPVPADLDDLLDKYVAFHRRRGNDPSVGCQLTRLARAAGLTVDAYRGWFDIREARAGVRPAPWAARDAMVAAGVATEEDVRRWGAALERIDGADERPLVFGAIFVAVCSRPAGRSGRD